MRKKCLLIAIALLLSLLVIGCGVPREEYDAVLAARDAGQAEVASLQSELAKAQSQVESLKSEVEALECNEERSLNDRVPKS